MKALYFENSLPWVAALKAATLFDKFAALGPVSPLKYAEIPEPGLPDARWLKVRNLACGLCGTDLHFMFMEMDPLCFPAAIPGIRRKFLGHELLGEVTEAGAEASGFAVGQRVALRIDWPSCLQLEITPPCRHCAEGRPMLCQKQGLRDLPVRDVGGGFSPFMIMHRSQPYKIPEALSDDAALLLEPTACALHGVLKAKPKSGDKVLVMGAGTIGLLTVAVARALAPEADIYCLARYPFQAALAERLGAKALGDGPDTYAQAARAAGARLLKGHFGNTILLGGFDTIYDTVGNDASLNKALRLVRGGGDVVLVGINFKPGKIDYTTIWNQEIRLTGINCHAAEYDGRSSFDHAAELLLAGAIRPQDFITHRFAMQDYKNAVKAFLSKGQSKAIKIVLEHR